MAAYLPARGRVDYELRRTVDEILHHFVASRSANLRRRGFLFTIIVCARPIDVTYQPIPVLYMSAVSENSQGHSSKSASVEEVQDGEQPSAAGPSIAGQAKLPEKTISCVSCRKRKLKCDRVKPKCGTCTRLRHDCEFPERRRNLGTKRRNIKELEARLAQVETQLISESKHTATATTTSAPGGEADWGMDMNLDLDDGLLNPSFNISQSAFGVPEPAPMILGGDFGSYDLIGLGLQEPLPPQDMMDELYIPSHSYITCKTNNDRHQIYFEKHHPTMPMMHKLRYYASLDRAPHMRPPICLRYAMWTVAASLSEKYSSFEDILYERARRYIQDAEMKVGPSLPGTFPLLLNIIGTRRNFRLCILCPSLVSDRYLRGCEDILLTCVDERGTDGSPRSNVGSA
jgi:hypothetical protein